jgi:outer membrane protein assembly factor BamA
MSKPIGLPLYILPIKCAYLYTMNAKRSFFIFFICYASQVIGQVNYIGSFNNTNEYTIKSIQIQGNKKTKSYIIFRELTILQDSVYNYERVTKELEQSQMNVYNTALFVIVKFHVLQSQTNSTNVDIIIEVKERFYILPEPIFELYDRNYKVWRKIYDSDIERVKYGVRFKYSNMTGRRDQLRIALINGYSKEATIGYSQPFADKKLRAGFGISAGVNKKLGASYIDSLNAGLPRRTCATCIGPNFKKYAIQNYFASINFQYRKNLYTRHLVVATYIKSEISDSVYYNNKNYFWNNRAAVAYLDMSYTFSFAKVDYFAYPTKGKSIATLVRNRFSKEGWNQTLIWASATSHYKFFNKLLVSQTLSASHRWDKFENSYYNQATANVFFSNIRSFEQFLIIPKSDIALSNAIRFKFWDKPIKLPFKLRNHTEIPLKGYARYFADIAYNYNEKPNYSKLHNKWLFSQGVALDVVTLYDTVYRLELGYNKYVGLNFYLRL